VALFSEGWATVFTVLMLLSSIMWSLSVCEMQDPSRVLPLARGVAFDERVIIRRVQEWLGTAKLDPFSAASLCALYARIAGVAGPPNLSCPVSPLVAAYVRPSEH